MIIIPKLKLGYQDSPKIASTTIFHYMHVALYGFKYDGHIRNNKKIYIVHNYFREGWCPDVRLVENVTAAIKKYENFYRFAITRDPVKRFISTYSNRVVFYRELSESSDSASKLLKAGLAFDPKINELVRKLANYMECQPSILHHARPQMDYLGPDLSIYTRIADISSVDEVVAEIHAFWMREGLTEICARTPVKPVREQTGGPKLGLNVLTPESFEKLIEYYCEDYERLPTVSLQAIKDEYFKARGG